MASRTHRSSSKMGLRQALRLTQNSSPANRHFRVTSYTRQDTDFTVGMWVNMNSLTAGTNHTLFQFYVSNSYFFDFRLIKTGGNYYTYIAGVSLSVPGGVQTSMPTISNSGVPLPMDGQWAFLCFTFVKSTGVVTSTVNRYSHTASVFSTTALPIPFGAGQIVWGYSIRLATNSLAADIVNCFYVPRKISDGERIRIYNEGLNDASILLGARWGTDGMYFTFDGAVVDKSTNAFTPTFYATNTVNSSWVAANYLQI